MYIIKSTFRNIKTGNEITYYIGKIMKNQVFTVQNRSISMNPDEVEGFKYLARCRKAGYLYFLEMSDKAINEGYTISVNPMEVK